LIGDDEGYTYFVGRKKFIIRRSGENIAAYGGWRLSLSMDNIYWAAPPSVILTDQNL